MNLELFLKMRDMMSGGLVKIAETARKTTNAVKGTNDALAQSFDRAKGRVDQLNNSLGRVQTRASSVGGMLRSLLPAFGIAGALALGGSSFKNAMAYDSSKRSIDFSTNGKGEQSVTGIKSINDKYGLSNEAGIEGFKTLAGSVRSLNMPLQETLRIYESVGAAAGAMGVDAEAQKGIFLALGQMASKGTVSAEELRGQIGERLPGAFGIAAKAMGVTERKLGEMMQRGEIAAKDFLPKFATELKNTFGDAAIKNAEGPQAIFNRFNNTLYGLSVTIGAILVPAVTALMNVFVRGIEIVREYPFLFTAFAAAIGGYVVAVNAASWATKIWAGFQWLLNTAMSANPIGIVIGLVAALVAGIIYAWKNFEGFRAVVLGLWEVFKTVFTNIGGFFKQIFSPIAEAIAAFEKRDWGGMAKAVGKLAFNISPVGLAANAVTYAKEGSFTKGVAENWARRNELVKNKSGDSKADPSQSAVPVGGALTNTPALGKGSEGDDMIKGIASGGPRIINININKMVEKIEVHAQNLTEGVGEIESRIEETFLRILNSGAKV